MNKEICIIVSVISISLLLWWILGNKMREGLQSAPPASAQNNEQILNDIQNLQQFGIPTGPMPDGSPNLYMVAIQSQITGVESERDKNAKVLGITPSQVVSPIGVTIPTPFAALPV